MVTFTLTITDDLGPALAELTLTFEVSSTVQPAPELESILPDPLETTVDVELFVTFTLDPGTGLEPIKFNVIPDDDGNPGAVDSPCVVMGGLSFDEPSEVCGFTFDTAGDYLLTIELRDTCAASSTIPGTSPKVAYEFSVTVDP